MASFANREQARRTRGLCRAKARLCSARVCFVEIGGSCFTRGPHPFVRDEQGQSTVEYALVVFSLLAIVVACGALWSAFDEGLFVSHATQSASHHLQGVAPGAIGDIFLY